MNLKLIIPGIAVCAISGLASAQVPDLLTAYDAGGAAMGAGGGAFYQTGVDTLSAFYNPAGLAYVSQRAVGLSYRNRPSSQTLASGSVPNPILNSSGKKGSSGISHLGFAVPMGDPEKGKQKGTLAFTYTLGGSIDDKTVGSNGLLYNGQALNGYSLDRNAQTDFFTIGYGWTTGKSKSTAYGIGLNYVKNRVSYTQTGSVSDGNGGQTTIFNSDVSGTSSGVGFTVGMLHSPNANSSLGLSYRSETKLSGGGNASGVYDRIPARLSAGYVTRAETKGENYALFGLGVDHFFSASNSSLFERKAVTAYSGGVEYNMYMGDARLPFRLGYSYIPAGGNDFGSRNGLTFGVGYRPADGRFGVDFNFGAPKSGSDFGIAFTYRFNK